jgi:hypothetical protein
VPKAIAFSLIFVINSCEPWFFICDSFTIYGISVAQKLFNFLRMCDIALLPSQIPQKWTLRQYWEYFFTFYTNDMRNALKKQNKPYCSQNAILPEDRTAAYYGKLAYKLVIQYAMYHVFRWYYLNYPPNSNPPARRFANFYDPKELLDHFVFGLTLCFTLSLLYNIIFHVVVEVLHTPFEPVMNSPFFATSFRDFWSNRWNMFVKENLHRIVFQPTMVWLKSVTPHSKNKLWKPPVWHALIGAFATFLFSGIIHEWVIVILTRQSTTWENLLFFVIQGIITTAEVILTRSLKRHFGLQLKMPFWIAIPLNTLAFLITTPFFLNPWMRADLLSKLALYTVIRL